MHPESANPHPALHYRTTGPISLTAHAGRANQISGRSNGAPVLPVLAFRRAQSRSTGAQMGRTLGQHTTKTTGRKINGALRLSSREECSDHTGPCA